MSSVLHRAAHNVLRLVDRRHRLRVHSFPRHVALVAIGSLIEGAPSSEATFKAEELAPLVPTSQA